MPRWPGITYRTGGPHPCRPAVVARTRVTWREMPKRFRPYGSAVDAESAALGRGRPRAGDELLSDQASSMTVPDIASLERMGQNLPRLYEQLARILVVQREEGQITPSPGQDADFWVVEAVQALAAAGQAADMMTAALTQARKTSAELRPAR